MAIDHSQDIKANVLGGVTSFRLLMNPSSEDSKYIHKTVTLAIGDSPPPPPPGPAPAPGTPAAPSQGSGGAAVVFAKLNYGPDVTNYQSRM